MRIPTLAIHLDRTVNDTGFNPNKENHLIPVLASAVKGFVAFWTSITNLFKVQSPSILPPQQA